MRSFVLIFLHVHINLVKQANAGKIISNHLTVLGNETILKCNEEAYYWRYQGRETFEIFDGYSVTESRNKTFGIIGANKTLIIHETSFQEAGKYACYGRSKSIISEIKVIVIDRNITCEPSPNKSVTNLPITFNCSFHYEARNSCLVTLRLHDEQTKRDFPADGNTSRYFNDYLWLVLSESDDLGPIMKLLLRIVFDCHVDQGSSKESIIYDTGISYNLFIDPHPRISFYAALACIGSIQLILVITFISIRFWKCSRKPPILPNQKPLPRLPEAENVLPHPHALDENAVESLIESSLCVPYSTIPESFYADELEPMYSQLGRENEMESNGATYELETVNDLSFYCDVP